MIKKYITGLLGGAPKTKTMLNYLVFVFISFIFWTFISLNNNIQYDMEIPVKISSVPDSTTIITEVPEYVNVSVKDKGTALLKFILGEVPTLNIKFNEYDTNEGEFYVSNADLRKKLKSLFENSTTLQSISIDEIKFKYTNLPGKKVPIKLDLDIRPNLQYIIHGTIKQDQDSVLVYSDRNTLADINEVYTSRLEERELTDTVVRIVSISPISGTKIVPDNIKLTIPVEPLISKRIKIPVHVKNMPIGVNVITFPSEVEASFLVPFSMYKRNQLLHAIVNYDDIKNSTSNKVGVFIDDSPALYNNITLEQDSVEYIIEKN